MEVSRVHFGIAFDGWRRFDSRTYDPAIYVSYRRTFSALVATLAATPISPQYDTGGFALGCQAYTFKTFTAFEAIDKTAQAGGKVIEFFPGQKLSADRPGAKLDQHMSDDDLAALKTKLGQAGIIAVNYGVVGGAARANGGRFLNSPKNSTSTASPPNRSTNWISSRSWSRSSTSALAFTSMNGVTTIRATKCGTPIMSFPLSRTATAASAPAPTPAIGWLPAWTRWNPSSCSKAASSVAISRTKMSWAREGHCVPYGTGVGKIKEILDELKAQAFHGNISIEYEFNWDNSVPDVKQCVDFVRAYGEKP